MNPIVSIFFPSSQFTGRPRCARKQFFKCTASRGGIERGKFSAFTFSKKESRAVSRPMEGYVRFLGRLPCRQLRAHRRSRRPRRPARDRCRSRMALLHPVSPKWPLSTTAMTVPGLGNGDSRRAAESHQLLTVACDDQDLAIPGLACASPEPTSAAAPIAPHR
jgi:hypothetical protein